MSSLPPEGGAQPPEELARLPVPTHGEIEAVFGSSARVLISDADRGRVTDAIGDAFAEGRLTRDEYEDRLTATMAARTLTDLVPVLEGLPPAVAAAALAPLLPAPTSATPPASDSAVVPGWYRPDGSASTAAAVAIFGGATRKGQWVVPAQMTAFAMFGGVELDLTLASFAQAETEIVAVAIFGGVDITVPEGITVHVDGIGIFGGFDQRAEGPGEVGAPVLRVRGAALFGGVDVKRKPRRKSVGGKGRPELT